MAVYADLHQIVNLVIKLSWVLDEGVAQTYRQLVVLLKVLNFLVCNISRLQH